MYLPRDLISHLYTQLRQSWHTTSPPVLLLVALEPDALCACRILTALLKRDYISHNIVPVSGYGDLGRVGEEQIQPMRLQNGGMGGTVICLGVGGLVDLGAVLGLEANEEGEDATGGVELWVVDARRPWNLGNVFGGKPPEEILGELDGNARKRISEVAFGQIQRNYRTGKGGIIVFDDGDITEQLEKEREAYFKLEQMPPIEDDGEESDDSESDDDNGDDDAAEVADDVKTGGKRKSWSDADEDDSDDEDRPRQRIRSNSQESIPVTPERPARRGLLINSTMVPSSIQSPSGSTTDPPPSHQTNPVSIRQKRRRLLRLKRQHEATLNSYYDAGTSYSEPISSLIYSLISDLGREDNNALWLAIVGVSSLELYGRSLTGVGISRSSEAGGSAGWGGLRGESIRQVLRDEVRRLNPPDLADSRTDTIRGETSGVIPTTARSPTDTSIRLSPEPRFLLIRHWSLYDSMLHSPYLASRLHLWTDAGIKRLHKFLAKMGVSLAQCRQSYTHMDMDLKKKLRPSLLKYAPMYGLDGLVPPAAGNVPAREGWGFVRSWGWKACLSAADVGVIVGAILEVGKGTLHTNNQVSGQSSQRSTEPTELLDQDGRREGESYIARFWDAYDALDNVTSLLSSLPATQHLHRAILRTGAALLAKRQVRHLRAFRMAVVKEGPDVQLFTHPGALTKLALWVAEAISEQERDDGRGGKKMGTPLVLAGLNEERGVYVVVGTGGGGGVIDYAARREREEKRKLKETRKMEKKQQREQKKAEREAKAAENGEELEDEDEDETEDEGSDVDEDDSANDKTQAKNRFGNAFQEVVEQTGSRVRIDSFEHCVVEVKKDDLGQFLEALSMQAVIG